jgi:hypothetical protein
MGSLSYALVALDRTPLAEYPAATLFNSQVVPSILAQINSKSGHLSAEQGTQIYVTFTDQDHVTFLCCCDKSVDSSTRVAFLNELQREWRLKYGPRASSFSSHEKDSEFGPVIDRLLKSYNEDLSNSIRKVKANLEEAQTTMAHNMELAMVRDATLNQMEDKVNDISIAADAYHRDAIDLRRRMCWERYRNYVFAAVGLLVVLAIILFVAYLKNGGSDDDSED